MTQTTPIIGSGKSGLEYRNLDNDGKQALLTHHKGSSAPEYAEAGCIWLDDTDTPWILKIYDGTDWLVFAKINASTNKVETVTIADKDSVTAVQDDYILFSDTSNGNALAKVAIGNVLDVFTWRSNEYLRSQNFNATVLTDAETIAWDLDANQVTSVTLAGNRTLSAPTNMKDGSTYILIVKQDATGSRTLTFSSAYKFSGGSVPDLTATANAVDILTFVSDGTNMYGVMQGDFR